MARLKHLGQTTMKKKDWIIQWRDNAIADCKFALRIKRISISQYIAAMLEILTLSINGLHILDKHKTKKEPSILDCSLN